MNPAPDSMAMTVARLRHSFASGGTRPLEWRLSQLRRLVDMVEENEATIQTALQADLGKPPFEAWLTETSYLASEARYAVKHLRGWARPMRAKIPWAAQPGRARVYAQPLGVVLIIAPWNYPVQLALTPLVGAIAGGNCAVIKPSELAPRSSAALAELVPRYLDADCFAVIEGGVVDTTALLAERFDHLFYTGNGTVGRVIMTAAAQHLTPMTLELGGKCPCIVDEDVDLEVAARRITWSKFFNAGQTCVAPDYVLVHEAIEKAFIDQMALTIRQFYGADPYQSPDYARIINRRHHTRLAALLSGADIAIGGEVNADALYIAPTVLRNVAATSPVMTDELFGPILPVLPMSSHESAIELVNARPAPLALYFFGRNKQRARQTLERTSSGGACINDAFIHLLPPQLPFGGVGPSGMGAYHGKASFDTFTHKRSVLEKATYLDPSLRYPPYTARKLRWMKRVT